MSESTKDSVASVSPRIGPSGKAGALRRDLNIGQAMAGRATPGTVAPAPTVDAVHAAPATAIPATSTAPPAVDPIPAPAAGPVPAPASAADPTPASTAEPAPASAVDTVTRRPIYDLRIGLRISKVELDRKEDLFRAMRNADAHDIRDDSQLFRALLAMAAQDMQSPGWLSRLIGECRNTPPGTKKRK